MLNAISIENIAVARLITIEFPRGFSVLTGQTGAGKSLVIDSLGYLTGDKIDRDVIRNGESKATITGLFSCLEPFCDELASLGVSLDDDGNLLISRSFSADGKNTVKINGKTSSLSVLRELKPILLNINGQEDNHALGDRSRFIGYLDSFGQYNDRLSSYRGEYEKLLSYRKELKSLSSMVKEKRLLIDLYKNTVKEIDAAKLTSSDEEDKLEKKKKKIKEIEKISKHANLVYRALEQNEKGASAVYLIERASAAMSQLSDVLDNAEDLSKRLDEIKYELSDIAAEAIAVLDDTDADNPEAQLDLIETRLNLISKLKRKYGSTVEEILAYRNTTFQQLKTLSDADEDMRILQQNIGRQTKVVADLAEELTALRKTAAEQLTSRMLETLRYLDLPKIRFSVTVDRCDFNVNGQDDVEMLISANPGEPMQSLEKVASGGELARVMLALKCAIAQKDGVDCIIFDEIDTGVSGATSEKIGLKLKELSDNAQIICVTHSPQIASKADAHFLISKQETNGRTESTVAMLDQQGRVNEISRIISGITVSEKQRNAAEDLLNASSETR